MHEPQSSATHQQYPSVPEPAPSTGQRQIRRRQPKKRRSGCLTAFLAGVGLVLAIAAAIWFLLPGLARPYDLKVKSSTAAYESALQKLGMAEDAPINTPEASADTAEYGNLQDGSVELSSEEVTSLFSASRPDQHAYKNVQIRLNKDNTVDAAGTIDTSYLFNDILKGKYTREDAIKAMPLLGVLPDKVNFHCNMEGQVKDNNAEGMSINSVSIMGVPVPGSLIASDQAGVLAANMLNEYLQAMEGKTGASYELIRVDDGLLKFEGKLPSSPKRVPAE